LLEENMHVLVKNLFTKFSDLGAVDSYIITDFFWSAYQFAINRRSLPGNNTW